MVKVKITLHIVLSFVLFFYAFSLKAQTSDITQSTIDNATIEQMFTTDSKSKTINEAAMLQKHALGSGYKLAGVNKEATTSFSGKDANGAFTLKMATQSYVKGKSVMDITVIEVVQGAKKAVHTWSEDEGTVYAVSNSKVLAQPKASVTLQSCVEKYFSTGVESCRSCGTCVTDCVKSRSKWWAKIICGFKCLGPCIKCGTNIFGFVGCVISAIKG